MREGYTVDNFIDFSIDIFIEVINFKKQNKVINLGRIDENSLNDYKDEYSIGVWKIKSK